MGAAINERRQHILKLVVQEFVESASAVASETLVRKYGLTISSATVRNELAALEEMGYLTHLHTSAGRIPTDAGYRFFVENLMDPVPLPPAEQWAIRHQIYQVQGELDQWIQLGGSVLARAAQNASVITPPQAYQARFRHVELISIHERTILLVLVLHDGTVRQQTLTPEHGCSQEELRQISQHLNQHCNDATVDLVSQCVPLGEDVPAHLGTLQQHVLDLVVRAMRQLEDQINRQVYSDGLIEMLSQPEFIPALLKEEDANRAIERMRQVLETLTSSTTLGALILQALTRDDVHVVIGTEHDTDAMHDYSVVLARYGIEGALVGVLGIIGPTRMAYPRSISTVRYTARVMSDLINTLYGGEMSGGEQGEARSGADL